MIKDVFLYYAIFIKNFVFRVKVSENVSPLMAAIVLSWDIDEPRFFIVLNCDRSIEKLFNIEVTLF